MISSKDIRDRLADALIEKSSLNDFEDWFVQNSWNVHKIADYDLLRLVYAIELRLSEYSSQHLSEDSLWRELRTLLQRAPMNVGIDSQPLSIESGSSSSVSLQPIAQVQPVDISPVRVFA